MRAIVKIIEPITPITHTAAETFRKFRNFSPDVDALPSTSSNRNAIAKRAPMVANPPSKLKYLKVVLKKFIGLQIVYERIEKDRSSLGLQVKAKESQKSLFPNYC